LASFFIFFLWSNFVAIGIKRIRTTKRKHHPILSSASPSIDASSNPSSASTPIEASSNPSSDLTPIEARSNANTLSTPIYASTNANTLATPIVGTTYTTTATSITTPILDPIQQQIHQHELLKQLCMMNKQLSLPRENSTIMV
jgi:hypothetical protein